MSYIKSGLTFALCLLVAIMVGWAEAPMDKPSATDVARIEHEAVALRYIAMPTPMLVVTPTPCPTPMPTPTPTPIPTSTLAEGYREDIPLSAELQEVLHTACEEYRVPTFVALGVMYTESRFDETAVSPSGCRGLMQLHPRYFPGELTSGENIEAGVKYLGELHDRYGDWGAALTAYNAGSDTGRRGYANAVLAAAEEWREL